MTSQLVTICGSIAGLTVTGATICDLDEIPDAIPAGKAMIFPIASNFVTGLSDVRDTFGTQTSRQRTFEYTLNYRLCYAPIGATLNLSSIIPGMMTMVMAFCNAVDTSDLTGAADNGIDFIKDGPTMDMSGNPYHGCDIGVRITEYL